MVARVEQVKIDVKSNWQPKYIVDVGCGCEVGLSTDDGCFIVLYPNDVGQWELGTHIPMQVAQLIAKLL